MPLEGGPSLPSARAPYLPPKKADPPPPTRPEVPLSHPRSRPGPATTGPSSPSLTRPELPLSHPHRAPSLPPGRCSLSAPRLPTQNSVGGPIYLWTLVAAGCQASERRPGRPLRAAKQVPGRPLWLTARERDAICARPPTKEARAAAKTGWELRWTARSRRGSPGTSKAGKTEGTWREAKTRARSRSASRASCDSKEQSSRLAGRIACL